MAYSKLYSSIVHSSLWTEPDHIRLLFITLLAIADREGFIYGSRGGLLRLANLDSEQCSDIEPFEALMSPDEDSSDRLRNPENEGRRIEEVPGGFHILNYAYYRGLRNEDDRREQNRLAQQRHREKKSQKEENKPVSAGVSRSHPSPSASASDSSEKRGSKGRAEIPTKLSQVKGFEEEWNYFIEHRAKKRAPMTLHAQALILKTLLERPADTVSALQMAIVRNWTGFKWDWFDNGNQARNGKPLENQI